jgi:hypothetical protein
MKSKKPKSAKKIWVIVALSDAPYHIGHAVYPYHGPEPVSGCAVSHSKNTSALIKCARRVGAWCEEHPIGATHD